MSDEKYSLIETGKDEEALFFSTDAQDQACIGHLRGDFGRGNGFWTTWWDHHEELKDQEFKDELDDVVNTLRKDGPLKDLASMQRFCDSHSQARMTSQSGLENFGLRVDTEKHRYYMRLCPMRGNYNFYIYCYKVVLMERQITALVVEPMKPCRVQTVSDTLDAMRGIVGGDIEVVCPFLEPVAVVCHGEGKVLGLPYNRPLMDESGLPYDILCGTFFIAGVSGENFVSLTDEQIQRYKSLYDNVAVLTVEGPAPQEQHSGQKRRTTKNKGGAER